MGKGVEIRDGDHYKSRYMKMWSFSLSGIYYLGEN